MTAASDRRMSQEPQRMFNVQTQRASPFTHTLINRVNYDVTYRRVSRTSLAVQGNVCLRKVVLCGS